MTLSTVTVYADDPDAYVDRLVTAASADPLTFTPTVAAGDGAYVIAATWQGSPTSSRVLRVPTADLETGSHHLYLSVPGSNDLDLGWVCVIDRD